MAASGRFPILIQPRRSRLFLTTLMVFHGLSLLSVWMTPWEIVWRLGLSFLVTASFWMACRRWKTLPSRLLLHPDGHLVVHENGTMQHAATLCLGALALPSLCVFSWQPEKPATGDAPGRTRRRSLTIFQDSLDPESLRRLRIWLRTSRPSSDC